MFGPWKASCHTLHSTFWDVNLKKRYNRLKASSLFNHPILPRNLNHIMVIDNKESKKKEFFYPIRILFDNLCRDF